MIKEENIKSKINISKIDKIPIDWQEKELGKIFKLTSGKTKPQLILENPKDKSIYPVYGGNRIIGYSSEFNLTGENIIIGRVGEYCGITKYINELCWITDNALYTKEYLLDVNINFLAYKLQHEDLSKLRSKGGQPLISQVPISIHKIILPKSIQEQTAIANLLSIWDKAIQTTNNLIEQKQHRKKWLMQMLLSGKKRLKGFEKEKWKEVRLGEIFDERNEKGNFNLPLLSVGAGGIYPQSDSIKKDNSNEDKSKYRKICVGDIGYNTMRMWQGRSAISSLEGIISPAYTVVTPKNNSDAKYFSFLFKTPHLINSFYRNSQGLVDDTLNCKYKDFAIVKAFVPPTKKEQEEIAKVLFLADSEITGLQKNLDYIKTQKKGLMQILLTGKKRLKTN